MGDSELLWKVEPCAHSQACGKRLPQFFSRCASPATLLLLLLPRLLLPLPTSRVCGV